ncbi:hypothetical protein GCM10027415_14580 [Humibacter ginsengisoli]
MWGALLWVACVLAVAAATLHPLSAAATTMEAPIAASQRAFALPVPAWFFPSTSLPPLIIRTAEY